MGNVFGGEKKDIKDVLKENDRMIKRAVRELEREIVKQEREQTKIAAEIKKHAKSGQVASAKSLAKSYVRTKNFITKFIMMKTQLKGISLQMQTIKSSHAMGEAMKGVSGALKAVNKQLNVPELNKIMADFMKENNIQELMQEEMSDALDDALMQDGNEDEETAVINQVMDELGIEFAASLPGAASGAKLAAKEPAEAHQPMAMAAGAGGGAAGAGGGAAAAAAAAGGGGAPGVGGLPPAPGADGVDMSDIEERLKNLRK